MSFQFMALYTGDYRRDTQHLSMMEHGCYLLMLMHCWDQRGPMPLDERRIFAICNARSNEEMGAARNILAEFFVRMDDGHYNHRMQREIERANAISGARSDAGKRGVEAKAKQLLSKRQASAKQVTLPPPPPPPLQPPLQPPPPPIPGEVSPETPSQPPSTGSASGKPARKRADKPAQGSETWDAYAEAYAAKYGTAPVRNAKVNAHMKHFVDRLGAAEAPAVARAYLLNRNGLYVASKHCTDLMLRDAEKLRTEWATGTVTHMRDARETDRLGSTYDMAHRVAARLAEKGIT